MEQWLCDKDVHWQLPVNGRKPKLSVEDRTLRAIMLSKIIKQNYWRYYGVKRIQQYMRMHG